MAQRYADHVVTVSEGAIAQAIRTLFSEAGILAEGAGAAAPAALEKLSGQMRGLKVVLVLTGANIDPAVLAGILADQ